MKDVDLEAALKRLRVPERGREFWDAFPERVTAALRSTPEAAPVGTRFARRPAWSFGLALACLAFGFCLGQNRLSKMICHTLLKDETELRQTARQFPGRVYALMQDEHGLHKLIEDQQ